MLHPQKCKHCNNFNPPQSKLDAEQLVVLRRTFAAVMRHNCYDVIVGNDECHSSFIVPISVAGVTEVTVNCHSGSSKKTDEYNRDVNWISVSARDFECVVHQNHTIVVNGQLAYTINDLNLKPIFDHLYDIIIDLNLKTCKHT